MASLYRRVMGEAFDALPPVLRRFHGLEAGGRAGGLLRVTRGDGRLRNLVAGAVGLPEAGEQVPLELHVLVEGDRERWVRAFGARRMVSVQWARGDMLMEGVGGVRFGFEVVIEPGGARFVCRRNWLLGLPLPSWLTTRIEAEVRGGDEGWWLRVTVTAPLVGRLVEYEGEVTQR